MTLLKADQNHGVALAGISGLVPRPVDIDQTHTGFTTLRTFRIYRFEPPAVIDGHAEEDEVYLVVLAGSVELLVRRERWRSNDRRFRLTAANSVQPVECAAYLPPHAEYQLTPLTSTDIAYARARPCSGRPPAILMSTPRVDADGVCDLLDESRSAEKLRVRLLYIDAQREAVALKPIRLSDPVGEGLIHLRTTPGNDAARIESAGAAASPIDSWDTLVVACGDYPTLRVAVGASAIGLVVAAQ